MWSDFLRLKVSGNDGDGKVDPPADDKVKDDKKGSDPGDPPKDKTDDDDDANLELDSFPKSAQNLIKKLRKENGDRRTETNNLKTRLEKIEGGFKKIFGGDDADADPEKQLEAVSGQFEQAVSENAILRLALSSGIGGGKLDYFQFLVEKKLGELKEGEELSEDDLEEVVEKARLSGTGKKANTSVDEDGKKGDKSPSDKNGEVTQEEFNKMGMIQKSKLYQTNRPLYDKLMINAKL